MSKKLVLTVLLVLAFAASGCVKSASTPAIKLTATKTQQPAPTHTPTLDKDGRRVVTDKDLRPYPVELPLRMQYDLNRTFLMSLLLERDTNINVQSLDVECDVLVAQSVYNAKYSIYSFHGRLSEWIKGGILDYSGLLCRKQDLAGAIHSYLTMKGQTPLEYPRVLLPIEINLDIVSLLTFHVKETLNDQGVARFTGVIRYPEVYTVWMTHEQMQVDLP